MITRPRSRTECEERRTTIARCRPRSTTCMRQPADLRRPEQRRDTREHRADPQARMNGTSGSPMPMRASSHTAAARAGTFDQTATRQRGL